MLTKYMPRSWSKGRPPYSSRARRTPFPSHTCVSLTVPRQWVITYASTSQADPVLLKDFLGLLRKCVMTPSEVQQDDLSTLVYVDMTKPEKKTKLVINVCLRNVGHRCLYEWKLCMSAGRRGDTGCASGRSSVHHHCRTQLAGSSS